MAILMAWREMIVSCRIGAIINVKDCTEQLLVGSRPKTERRVTDMIFVIRTVKIRHYVILVQPLLKDPSVNVVR